MATVVLEERTYMICGMYIDDCTVFALTSNLCVDLNKFSGDLENLIFIQKLLNVFSLNSSLLLKLFLRKGLHTSSTEILSGKLTIVVTDSDGSSLKAYVFRSF